MWVGTRVLVTGGRGFLGTHIVRRLSELGADPVAVGRREADLTLRGEVDRLVTDVRPAVVVHCGVQGGGIGWMAAHPVESGRDNSLMNIHLLESSNAGGVELFIGIGSACAYPRICPIPFMESSFLDGPPEPTNAPYAESKRLMVELGKAYRAQHGLKTVFPMLANLYGPGDALTQDRAHAVAGLILRCLDDPEELSVWGSGRATREFLFIEDAANGVLACAGFGSSNPVNIGTGIEVPISQLAQEIANACGYKKSVSFDPSKPDGQPRKCLDVSLATRELGWQATTSLREGLAKTVGWYRSQLGFNQ